MTGIIRWYVVHPEVEITIKFGGEQASAHRERGQTFVSLIMLFSRGYLFLALMF